MPDTENMAVVHTRERGLELDILNELRQEMRQTRESMARMEGEMKAMSSGLTQAQSNASLIAVLQSEVTNLKVQLQSQRAATLGIIAIVVPTILAVITMVINVYGHK